MLLDVMTQTQQFKTAPVETLYTRKFLGRYYVATTPEVYSGPSKVLISNDGKFGLAFPMLFDTWNEVLATVGQNFGPSISLINQI